MVVKSGKTGTRVTFPQPIVKRYLDAWREISLYTNDDDYIFTHFNGKKMPENGLIDIFSQVLDHTNIKEDELGQSFALYSLRHFYATERLKRNVQPYMLAKVMGTSMKMLQEHYDHVMIEDQYDEITKR